MTRKGCSPLPEELLAHMALLVQVHLLTHPERVGRRFGVSAEYVRQQWRKVNLPPITEVDVPAVFAKLRELQLTTLVP